MEIHTLKEGAQIISEKTIQRSDLSPAYNTGNLPLLATPALISFMISTAVSLTEDNILYTHGSIGIETNVQSMTTAKEGEKLTCTAVLKFVEEDRLFFDIVVINQNYDTIGIGAHERMIIRKKDFE